MCCHFQAPMVFQGHGISHFRSHTGLVAIVHHVPVLVGAALIWRKLMIVSTFSQSWMMSKDLPWVVQHRVRSFKCQWSLFVLEMQANPRPLLDAFLHIRQFTSTLVVTSHKINACSMFASLACLQAAHVSVALLLRDQLNANDADMEQALLLCYVTTRMLMKCSIDWHQNIHLCTLIKSCSENRGLK